MLNPLCMIFFSITGFFVAVMVLLLFGIMVSVFRDRTGLQQVSEQAQSELKYANEDEQVERLVRCPVCQTLNPAGAPCAVCDREE